MSKKKIEIPKSATEIDAWCKLAFDDQNPNQLETLSKDQLSVYVTHFNLPNGTKSSPKMMCVYIKMHLASNLLGIKDMYPGENFAEFKVARIKKEIAKLGQLPEGTFAELSMKLLQTDKFKAAIKKSLNGGNSSQGGGSNNKSSTAIDPIIIAKEVLSLGEQGNYEGILSLMGEKITKQSTIGQMKKAYLKLSLLIHPDKLSHFPDAKKCFQELVDAYERLSKPEKFEDMLKENNTKNQTTIRRPNTGCYKTRVYCPRCKHEWNTPLDGNPEFAYTLMMTGMKNYHCTTCLLEFGCISAIHKCPFCRQIFEYHPDDFHRKVTCGSKKCTKQFGFYEDYIKDRVMKEIKEQIMGELQNKLKKEEGKRRRAKSYQNRNQLSEEEQKIKDEQAYLIGLNDLCPRCGIDLHDLEENTDQYQHLRECKDEYKHKEYKKQKEQEKKEKQIKEKLENKQNETQAHAVFNAFGGQNTMLWLLSEDQLKKECQISNVDDTGSKEEMIIRLSEKRKGQRAIGGSENLQGIPKNLNSMTLEQLRGLLLAQGLNPNKYGTKSKMINAIERIQIGLDKAPQRLMLEQDKTQKQDKMEDENDDDDDEEKNSEDSEYEQPDLDELRKEIKNKKIEKLRQEKLNKKRKSKFNIEKFYDGEQNEQIEEQTDEQTEDKKRKKLKKLKIID